VSVVRGGLNAPRHLTLTRDGLWVAEADAGGPAGTSNCVTGPATGGPGTTQYCVGQTGAVALIRSGRVVATVGLPSHATARHKTWPAAPGCYPRRAGPDRWQPPILPCGLRDRPAERPVKTSLSGAPRSLSLCEPRWRRVAPPPRRSATRSYVASDSSIWPAGAALYVAGALLPGSAPKPDAATSQVIAFFAARHGSLLTGFSLELLALGLLLCFLGYLRAVIASAHPSSSALATSMVAAWVATVAIVAAGTLPVIAIIWRGTPSADPVLARFAYDIQTLATYAATSTAALVSIVAPCVVIWRTGVLPRWLSVLGAQRSPSTSPNCPACQAGTARSPVVTPSASGRCCGSCGSPPPASA
jgi:hypothetical protein